MKNFVFSILLISSAYAQTIYVAPEIDIKTIRSPHKENLLAQQQMKKAELRGVREEIMNYSHMFLQNQISVNEFDKALWSWSQLGWSQEEKWVLIDTLKKSNHKFDNRNLWICRMNPDENCQTDLISYHKIPLNLQQYEGLLLDGQPIPAVKWDGTKISNSFYNWTFVSSKYKAFYFRGTWKELQKQNAQLEPLVLGSCNTPTAHPDIQNLSTQIYYAENCIKPSLRPIVNEPGIYEKHKKAIWWTVGLVVGVGVISTSKNKTIVIDKPGFL